LTRFAAAVARSALLPSLARTTSRQHSGTEHTADTGTDIGAVTMPLA
jgi:hypothetical protein